MRRIAVIAAALSLFHAACESDSSTPAPVADTATSADDTTAPADDAAAPADDTATPADDTATTPATCEKECFFNVECADSERCAETEGQLYGCCEAGARGTAATGEPCTKGANCASGVCIEVTDGSLCTEPCTASDTCPTSLPKCNTFTGACIPE
jgi:hypothetical protein